MSDSKKDNDRLLQLAGAVCNTTATEDELVELYTLLRADRESRNRYVEYCWMHVSLRLQLRARGAARRAHEQIVLESAESPTAVPTAVFGTALHSAGGYFSSGWPVAYLVATLLLGVGLLVGYITQVPQPSLVANKTPATAEQRSVPQPQTTFVGRVTGTVDCQWADESTAAFNGAHVSLGRKYDLASGLMEITYDSGARVVLQGPCAYEVTTPAGGFLAVGKMVARVEKRGEGLANPKSQIPNQQIPNPRSLVPNPSFAVRTPSAAITDLGTEFGVEVEESGRTSSHVFQGSIEVRAIAVDQRSPAAARVLHEDESAVVESDGSGGSNANRVTVLATAEKTKFVRKLPKTTLKTLDLVDVVAGGDGYSSRRNAGIDPTDGRATGTSPKLDEEFKLSGDGKYHRVQGLPLVDGVFIPDGRSDAVQTDSAGHTFAGFGATANRTAGYFWAGGTIPTAVDHPRTVNTRLGNVDYASAGHGLLFLHANKGITFDLDAVRRANPGSNVVRFRSTAGNTETVSAEGLAVSADVWVLVDGQRRFQRRDIDGAAGEFSIVVPLRGGDRFLTLAATDGGNDIGNDWILFGDPRLELATESEAK